MRAAVLLAVMAICLAAAPAAAARQGGGGVHGAGAVLGGSSIALRTAASPPPCEDRAYNFIGPSAHWASQLRWRFRASSTPAGLGSSNVLAVLKKSFRNIVTSRNDCGLADRVSATHGYLGTTSRRPNITQSGACGTPDGHNVIGFGNLDNYYAGYTCIWWNAAAQIYEADVRLDPEQAWWLPGRACNNGLSMESLVTHELGHAYGLDHVSESAHGRLTMSVYIDGLCQNQEATLGTGDVRGLRALY